MVLCAHSNIHRAFTEDDISFMQAVANVLGGAIERNEAQERLEEVREAERSRIARDLHDEALQDLSGAMAEAQLARRVRRDDSNLSERLERLSAALGRAEQQVRGAVYDLSFETERDRPFSELLESLVELHRSRAPEQDISLEVRDRVLSGPRGSTGRELLRIVGEAITNARRHSEARNINVLAGTSSELLWAEVSDDGRGFDATQEPHASAAGGMGIRGMVDRARAIGGALRIESEPGQGTKVSFEMPLRTRERDDPEGVPEAGKSEDVVRVLLVEDHAAVREAIAVSFQREQSFEVVAQAGSIVEARGMLDEIDVSVIDFGLPDGYGGELIRDLREANPRAQALVLSASLERGDIARAVEAGAAGVLSKTAHLDEVVEAVRRLRAGEPLMSLQEVVELLRFAGSRREEELEARREAEKLTSREVEVLQALAEGLGSEEIADRLHISLRTERATTWPTSSPS